MTWGGKQGFQSPIAQDSLMVDGFTSALGMVHQERGLTYYEVEQSGHMVPQFVPWVSQGARLSLRLRLTKMLGRRRTKACSI
jgi:hypothetical protein